MTLLELQKKASEGYSDGDGLGDYFDPVTGQPSEWHPGDSLEWFMAIEIAEGYDSDTTDDKQVWTAIQALESGIADLQGAINNLRKG